MRLKESVLSHITPEVRLSLQIELKVTEQTIIRYVKANEENGPLTTAGALQVLKKHLQVLEVGELTEQKSTVPAA